MRLARVFAASLPLLFSATLCAQNCGLMNISPLNTAFPPSGGSGSATIQPNGTGCSWTATLIGADTSWVTIQGATSGAVFNGVQITISYTVAPNPGAVPRHVALSLVVTGGASDVFSIDEASPATPPLVMTCTTPNGPTTVGTPYTDTCTISGGTPPYVSNINGALPPGISPTYGSNFITIAGTPTTPISGYGYLVHTVDGTNILGQTASQYYSGAVAAIGPNCYLDQGNQGLNQTFSPSGGSGSFYFTPSSSGCTWTASAGAAWVTLQLPVSGNTAAGVQTTLSYNVSPNPGNTSRNTTLVVTTSSGTSASFGIYQTVASRTTLTMTCSNSAGPSHIAAAYSATCAGSGGTPPYIAQINGGALPAGMTATQIPGGLTVSGTPTQAGPYTYVVFISDSDPSTPQVAAQTFSGSIAASSCMLSTGSRALTQTFSAAGGSGSATATPDSSGCTWTASTSASWITLQGAIAGSSATGFPITVPFSVAANSTQTSRSASVTISLSSGASVSYFIQQNAANIPTMSMQCSTTGGPSQVAVPYSNTCSVFGGAGGNTYILSNALPPGITSSLTPKGFTMSGTPTAAGPYQYVLTVEDNEPIPQKVSQTFAGTILPAAPCTGIKNPLGGIQLVGVTGSAASYGAGSVTFTAPGCPWAIYSNASWLILTGTTSGVLSASAPSQIVPVPYSIQANPTSAPRQANFTFVVNGAVADTAPLTQNASNCTFSVTPSTIRLTASGGPANITFVSDPAGCVATVTSTDWLGGSAVNGDVDSFLIPPNVGAARSGTLLFGIVYGAASGPQATVTISQDAGTQPFAMSCASNSPYTAVMEIFDVECAAAGGVSPYSWKVNGAAPAGATPNQQGYSFEVTGYAYQAGPYNFTVSVADSSVPPLTATSQVFSGNISPPVLEIQCTNYDPPVQGLYFSNTCSALNGTPPFQWSVSANLPDGLSLLPGTNGTATVAGTPTVSGAFDYTLQVADSSTPAAQKKTFQFGGNIPSAPSLTCTPPSGPAVSGISYTATCTASGGTAPYHWSMLQPLPPGLNLTVSLDTSTGTIAGTPPSAGPYSYIVSISDSESPTPRSALQSYSGTISLPGAPLLTVTPTPMQFTYTPPEGPLPLGSLSQALSVFSSAGSIPFTASATSSGWLSVPSSGVTPGNLLVSVNVQNLAAGRSYSGQIVISAPGANPSSVTVPVTLTILTPPPPILGVSPSQLTMFAVSGGAPDSPQITVFNNGGGTMGFTASGSGGNWLTLGVTSGSASPGVPAAIPFKADPNGLAPGTYSGSIVIRTINGSQTAVVNLNFAVSAGQSAISLSPTWLNFVAFAHGTAPAPQSLSILDFGPGTLHWTATSSTLSGGSEWLAINPLSGTSPNLAAVIVDPSHLDAGTYYGSIQITAPEAPASQTVTVAFNVLNLSQNEAPTVAPAGVLLTGTSPSGALTLTNFGGQPLSFTSTATTQDGRNWLTVTPSGGTVTPGSLPLTVRADTTLTAGVWQGQLRIAFSDGTVNNVSVVFVQPATASRAAALQPNAASGGCVPSQFVPLLTSLGPGFTLTASQPVNLEAAVVDDCANPVSSGSVALETSTGDPGLSLTSVSGGSWHATWVPVTSSPTVTMTLAALQGALSGQTQLQGTVGAAAAGAAPQVTSVVNSASYLNPGQVPEGAWVSIFGNNLAQVAQTDSGPFPISLNGTSVLVGATALPLLFVSPNQINALVPSTIGADSIQSLVVERNGTASVPSMLAVADVLPALYSVNQTGSGQGAILIANTALIADSSRPVHAGEYLEIYATGLGQVNSPANGLATTILTPSVTIGGVPVTTVSYSGLAPGQVGLYQINVQVPNGVAAGSAIAVVVTADGKASNTVTIAVQ